MAKYMKVSNDQMNYYKARIDIQTAAKKRKAEAEIVVSEARKTLEPTMLSYDIKDPHLLVERLTKAIERMEQTKENQEKVSKLAHTLQRYFAATNAVKEFDFVATHIASVGDAAEAEGIWTKLPTELQVVELSAEQVRTLFHPYEAGDGSLDYGGEAGMAVGRLQGLVRGRGLSGLMSWGDENSGVEFSAALRG